LEGARKTYARTYTSQLLLDYTTIDTMILSFSDVFIFLARAVCRQTRKWLKAKIAARRFCSGIGVSPTSKSGGEAEARIW
jgi:hypothetical protein